MTVEKKFEALNKLLKEKQKILIMFSGGLDSAVLAYCARQVLGTEAGAVIIESDIISAHDRDTARTRADELGLSPIVIHINELSDKRFKTNDPERCYYCRKIRNRAVAQTAADHGFSTIAEGMNASDLADYRPGLVASNEDGIWKPFIECAITKNDIQAFAKSQGLPWWNTPSTVCLCSRIPHGSLIQEEDLQRIEKAETYIRSLGIDTVRVRSLPGPIAFIEVPEPENLLPYRTDIISHLKPLGFIMVSLDMEGFASGKLNRTIGHENK